MGDSDDPTRDVTQQPDRQPRTVLIPGPTASEEELAEFRRKVTEDGLRPVAPQASLFYPSSAEFVIDCDGPATRLHAALDEIFLPGEDGSHEILEIPPARDLADWQTIAGQVSPRAEMVLYFPDAPRLPENARFLGRTLIFEAPSENQARILAEERNWRFSRSLGPDGPYLAAVGNPLQALQLLKNPAPDRSLKIAGNFGRAAQKRFIPNDPLFPRQWHLNNTNTNNTVGFPVDLNITSAWDSVRGSNVIVGVADDGLDLTHPDLVTNLATGLHYNWRGGPSGDPSPRNSSEWHGTAVAGLIAARGNNSVGVTGVAPGAKLAGLSILSGNVARDADLIAMLKWKPDQIAVKNMSFSTSPDNGREFGTIASGVKDALVWATENGRGKKGTVLVQANGNGNTATVFGSGLYTFPLYSSDDSQWDEFANSVRVISVAAINSFGQPADYTEHGANISVCAPSSRAREDAGFLNGLVTTGINGLYRTTANPFGGTSGSAALVSGVAALMLEANPTLGWRDVKQILMQTARQPSTSFRKASIKNQAGQEFSYIFGAGVVDADAAVQAVSEHQNLPPMITASRSVGTNLRPKYGDATGESVSLTLDRDMRMESVALTFSANVVVNFYSLVFYIKSPSGTEIRMNCIRGSIGGVIGGTNIVFTTPFFWGESGRGTWTVRAVDEMPTGYTPGEVYKTVSSVGLTWYGSSAPSAPANDSFESPAPLTGTSGTISADNTGATRQTRDGEPNHAGGRGGGSLWWSFLAPVNGFLNLDASASSVSDTLLAVYTGDSLKTLTSLAANDNISTTNRRSRITRLPLELGQIVWIVVDGKNRERGALQLSYQFQAAAIYDNFAEPKMVSGASWSDNRSTAGVPAYGSEIGEQAHAGTLNKSVWYRWSPGVSGTATVTTAGSGIDTVLAVYRGPSLGQLTRIAQNDNESIALRSSRLSFGLVPGEIYHVAVDGKTGGAFSVRGSVAAAPTPPGQTVPTPPPPAPTNNVFGSAQTLTNAPLRITGLNRSAGQQTGEPNVSDQSASVWYLWTAPRNGLVTVTTKDSLFDTTLGAYRGTSLTTLQTVAFNDNFAPGQRWSSIRFQASAGTSYYLRVDGVRGATGRFYLNLTY